MGITNKTDGKSSDGKMSDKFTQRSKDGDSYSEHDPTDTVEYQKEQVGSSLFFFALGFVLITMGIVYVFQRPKMDLDYERELAYKRLAERDEKRRIEEAERLKSQLGQFRDV